MERAKRVGENCGHAADLAYGAKGSHPRYAGAHLAACKSGDRGARAGRGPGATSDGGGEVPLEVAQARAWAERHRAGD